MAMSSNNGGPARAAVEPFGLSVDEFGRLVLIGADGRRHVGVNPVRAFPLSEPGRWVSLVDANGSEIVCLPDLEELPPATRRLLVEELGRREFLPIIRRILSSSASVTPTDFDVETDRGPVRFTIDSDVDLRRLGPDRVLIADARGLRYLVPDVRALDAASRRILDRFL